MTVILFPLVSVDLEYHDGWFALKSSSIRISGVVRIYLMKIDTTRPGGRNVEVGNNSNFIFPNAYLCQVLPGGLLYSNSSGDGC